jgi:hypothetical protein
VATSRDANFRADRSKTGRRLNDSAYNVAIDHAEKVAESNRSGAAKMVSRRPITRKRLRGGRSKAAIIQKIIRLEERVWEVAQKRDAIGFTKLVPSDAVMIFQSGIVLQSEYLATMNERTISRYEIRNIRAFMPNATTVILYYEALRLGEQDGKAFPSSPVIESTTWIKRAGKWVAVLNQETPIGGR